MKKIFQCSFLLVTTLGLYACGGGSSGSNPTPTPNPTATPDIHDIDLLNFTPSEGLIRLYGSSGQGDFGVPVSGGYDLNGDGHLDFAMASMIASPQGRNNAGEVFLALGNGDINYTIDSAEDGDNLLRIIGDGESENTGSEIWMGDVNGDGLGDLLIARQNYSTNNKIGAGAVSIVFGSSHITTLASGQNVLDLRDPDSNLNVLTLVGASELDRLGIWLRTDDVDGDGIDDLAIGADQHDSQGSNSGSVYLIRGGEHLNNTVTIDLSDVSNSAIATHLISIEPPSGSNNFHFGATLNLGDLDNNGRAELLVGATINRAGASLPALNAPSGSAVASSGSPNGRLYIVWDDNFPTDWTDITITLANNHQGSLTDITGGSTGSFNSRFFGEEILASKDYDGNGNADVFVGDITGSTFDATAAGLGFVFFDAPGLKDRSFSIANIPSDISMTTIFGAEAGAISSDTALHGDFDNDGIDDLAVASPHASPFSRDGAGAVHILWGQSNWPNTINLAPSSQPAHSSFAISNIYGALGTQGGDVGDTLGYSAAAGDLDNDGLDDLIVNEMVGNGIENIDVGNLIVISGSAAAAVK